MSITFDLTKIISPIIGDTNKINTTPIAIGQLLIDTEKPTILFDATTTKRVDLLSGVSSGGSGGAGVNFDNWEMKNTIKFGEEKPDGSIYEAITNSSGSFLIAEKTTTFSDAEIVQFTKFYESADFGTENITITKTTDFTTGLYKEVIT